MDIVERLRGVFLTISGGKKVSLRAANAIKNVSLEAADKIERLRNNQSILITSFRINMMRLRPDYSHEEFDKDIAAMLKEKE